MAYLGNDLQVAFPTYRNIDDISGSFNGVTTSFPLTVAGVAPIPAPINSQQCLISVNGVVQRPDDSGTEGFRLSGGNIIFASAPAGGVDFFGVILAGADYVNIGANFPSGTAVAPSITFDSDLDTGIYNPAGNQIGFTTSGVQRLVINSSGQISGGLGTAAAPVISFISDPNTGIYSPGADQVAISTGGTQRLTVDGSGNVISAGNFYANGTNGVVLFSADPANYNISRSGGDLTFKGAANINVSAGGGTSSLVLSSAPYAAFNVGGSERLRITSAGLVGVGTSSPSVKLEVSGTGTDCEIRSVNGTVNAQWYQDTSIGASVFGTFSNNALTFRTNGSRALTIDTSQRVGIGTTSPSQNLDVSGAGTQVIRCVTTDTSGAAVGALRASYLGGGGGSQSVVDLRAGDGYAYLLASTNNPLVFGTNNAERARIDSSGRLLVGTSSARSPLTHTPSIQVEGLGYQTSTVSVISNSNDSNGAYSFLGKSRGTSLGSNTIVQSGDEIGGLDFIAADGTQLLRAARITALVDGTPGTNDMPGRLVFSTTADGESSPTERMRITNKGGALFYASTTNVVGAASSEAAGTTYYTLYGSYGATSTTTGSTSFLVYTNGNVQNTNNSYSAISDIKLKENIVDAGSQWADLKALRVRNYNLKEGQTHRQIGLIAQEVELISPGLVYESPDRDDDGNDLGTVTKSVNYSVLYMKAVKALQEAMERIETLEARLTAAGI